MYHSILLKVSGEALGSQEHGTFDPRILDYIAIEIKAALGNGLNLAIVAGGGNIFRARIMDHFGLSHVEADQVGILGGIVNALLLQQILRSRGIGATAYSVIGENAFMAAYVPDVAKRKMESGEVVIIGGGMGEPYFTHDTAGVKRALELGCEVMLKASDIDGVYDSDPDTNPQAKRYETLSYDEALAKKLAIMDETAFSMARAGQLPIIVYKMTEPGALRGIIRGERVGTLVN